MRLSVVGRWPAALAALLGIVLSVGGVFAQDGTPAATPDAGPRAITHAAGTTEITGTPQRIVALEWTYAEDLLAIGVQPVGVADIEGYNTWVNVEPALAADAVDIGTRQEPSLESIAALEPDLIIGVVFRHETVYEDFSAIAPTLLFDPYEEGEDFDQLDEMEQTFLAIADAVNRRAEGEAALARLDRRYDELEARLEQAGKADAPFVLAQAYTAENVPQIRLFLDNAMAVAILEEIGLDNAYEGSPDIYGFNTVGVEGLVGVQDANFLYVVQDSDNVFANQLAEDPVWSALAFVKEGRTYSLGGDTWTFGGPLSADLLATKVVDLLTA